MDERGQCNEYLTSCSQNRIIACVGYQEEVSMLGFEKFQFLMKKLEYECNKIRCACCLLVRMIVDFLKYRHRGSNYTQQPFVEKSTVRATLFDERKNQEEEKRKTYHRIIHHCSYFQFRKLRLLLQITITKIYIN